MKRFFITVVLVISALILFAQNKIRTINERPENNFNLNLFGDASIISINYERLFIINPNLILTGQLGLGYNEEFQICIFEPCSPPEQYLTVPHHVTLNLGNRRNFFEFGLGDTIICGNTSQHYFLYPIAGYRLQPLRSINVNFRIYGSIPFTGLDTDDIIFIPFGLSTGVCF